MHGNYQVWTQDRIDRLIALWGNGGTASAIGFAMGMTRNAILGKVFRLGLAPRTSGFPPRENRPERPRPRPRLIKTRPGNPVGPPPGFIAAVSPITGNYVSLRKRPRVPELTKTELRAQLTLAVINTK